MYYKEKLINGVLMCKTTPDGAWRQCCIHTMSIRIIDQDKEILKLKRMIEEVTGFENLVEDH